MRWPGLKKRAMPVTDTRLEDDFPFVTGLEAGTFSLMRLSTDMKISALNEASLALTSEEGRRLLEKLGFASHPLGASPDPCRFHSRRLQQLFSGETLIRAVQAAFPEAGCAALDGPYPDHAAGCWKASFPAGPAVIISDGNSVIPALTAVWQAVASNCPVALRGSKWNYRMFDALFEWLRGLEISHLSTLLNHVHLFYSEHREEPDRSRLARLLSEGPFSAGVFWGEQDSLDFYINMFSQNPNHPAAIPIAPRTGAVVIDGAYIKSRGLYAERDCQQAARAIASGEHLPLIAPTAAVFIGDRREALRFAEGLAQALQKTATPSLVRSSEGVSLRLNRLRQKTAELGSRVFVPQDGSAAWSVVLSDGRFTEKELDENIPLHISQRPVYVEIAVVSTYEEAVKLLKDIPSLPSNEGIHKVETVICLTDTEGGLRLMSMLRHIGVTRIVSPDGAFALEPSDALDGIHLIRHFTREMVYAGAPLPPTGA